MILKRGKRDKEIGTWGTKREKLGNGREGEAMVKCKGWETGKIKVVGEESMEK